MRNNLFKIFIWEGILLSDIWSEIRSYSAQCISQSDAVLHLQTCALKLIMKMAVNTIVDIYDMNKFHAFR